jgi:hypothetical protein
MVGDMRPNLSAGRVSLPISPFLAIFFSLTGHAVLPGLAYHAKSGRFQTEGEGREVFLLLLFNPLIFFFFMHPVHSGESTIHWEKRAQGRLTSTFVARLPRAGT